MTAVTIYSKPGCHLCDEMKALVARVARTLPSPPEIREVDITTDAGLEDRYGLEIPVLLVDGRKVAKYRIEEGALRRVLTTRHG